MKSSKNLWIWAKKYIPIILFIIILNFILQWLYSYIALFVEYAFVILGNENSDVNLPTFLINFFNSFSDTLTIILVVGITMVLLQLFRSFLRFLDGYYRAKGTELIAYDMRTKLYNHIIDLSYSYHNNSDIGDLIQRSTSDIDTSSSFICSQFPELISIFMTIAIGAYQVGKINLLLMGISLLSLPLLGISSIIWFKYLNKTCTDIENEEAKLTTVIQENVNGARVVKAFANEKYELDKMHKANDAYYNKLYKLYVREPFFWGFSDFVATFEYALTIAVAIYLAYKDLVTPSDITACLLLLGMVIWPIRGLGRIISNYGKAIVAANRIVHVLDEKDEYQYNGDKKPLITGDITFNNVSFKFPDSNNDLLKNISFHIKAGETIAIVGKTGCGKTTICNLINRFLDYTEGTIYLDDTKITDIDKHYLRQNVKMILQDPFLFTKTVYENIAITNDTFTLDDVKRAAKLAYVDEEINHFEKGYVTMVGEKGTTLSGGQKQRIAIARMLISDAPILIFDDSLSALDTKTDYLIRQALAKKDKKSTMIIITHRITTAKEADRILVLNNGQIEAFASHKELVDKPGLYQELWKIQGDLEIEFKDVLKGGELNV